MKFINIVPVSTLQLTSTKTGPVKFCVLSKEQQLLLEKAIKLFPSLLVIDVCGAMWRAGTAMVYSGPGCLICCASFVRFSEPERGG